MDESLGEIAEQNEPASVSALPGLEAEHPIGEVAPIEDERQPRHSEAE
jgi:hypothetical protein